MDDLLLPLVVSSFSVQDDLYHYADTGEPNMQLILGLALNFSLGAILFGFIQGGGNITAAGKALISQQPGELGVVLQHPGTPNVHQTPSSQGTDDLRLAGIMELMVATRENFRKVSDALGR